jgi:hypothetical protein
MDLSGKIFMGFTMTILSTSAIAPLEKQNAIATSSKI